MLSFFGIFNDNLKQFSCNLWLNECQNVRQLSVELSDKCLNLVIDGKHVFAMTFNESSIQLTPICLKQLNAFRTSFGDNSCLTLSFTLSSQMAVIPTKRSVPKTSVPVNVEIINEFFCHNHSHGGDDDDGTQDPAHCLHTQMDSLRVTDDSVDHKTNPTRPPMLTTLDQIMTVIDQKIGTKYLFESQDKRFSLVLNVLNRRFIHTSITDESVTDGQILPKELALNFSNQTSVLYKVFKCNDSQHVVDPELMKYRFSFDIQWFPIETNLLMTLIKTLIKSTKTVLPIDLRFESESQLYLGFLDF